MTIENDDVQPSHLNPEDKKKLHDAILEIDNSLVRIGGERDLIKSILQRIEDEIGIKKKVARKLARTYHKDNFAELKEEEEYVETTFAQLFPNRAG